MAGRTSPNQIYNVSLTTDGKDTARVILEREHQHRKDTARLSESQEVKALADDEEEEEMDETDKAPQEDSTKMPQKAPDGLPGDHAAHPIEEKAEGNVEKKTGKKPSKEE
jgi:hypothetical protein